MFSLVPEDSVLPSSGHFLHRTLYFFFFFYQTTLVIQANFEQSIRKSVVCASQEAPALHPSVHSGQILVQMHGVSVQTLFRDTHLETPFGLGSVHRT